MWGSAFDHLHSFNALPQSIHPTISVEMIAYIQPPDNCHSKLASSRRPRNQHLHVPYTEGSDQGLG